MLLLLITYVTPPVAMLAAKAGSIRHPSFGSAKKMVSISKNVTKQITKLRRDTDIRLFFMEDKSMLLHFSFFSSS